VDPTTQEVVAAKLERESARNDGRVRLQGRATSAANPQVVILGGHTADLTTAINDDRLRSVDGSRFVTPNGFFEAATAKGNQVNMGGTLSGGSVKWERAEIELEHQFDNERRQGSNELENEFQFEFENEFEGAGSN